MSRNDRVGDPVIFVLRRELSEVHLLLDNISSSADKSLPITTAPGLEGLDADWLLKICQIEWPPEDSAPQAAEEAELLIRVKDHLNALAKPASGLTIAFTLMVTQETIARVPTLDDNAGAPSRGSLACSAYPDLVGKARGFRGGVSAIRGFLLVWLIFTCVVSWYITFGNAALAQRASAQAAYELADKGVQDLSQPAVATTTTAAGSKTPPAAPAPGAVTAAKPAVVFAECQSDPPIPLVQWPATLRQACLRRTIAADALSEADTQVAHWTFNGHKAAGPGHSAYALALAGILGTAILPVLYGILGAGAATLRALSRKMKLSLLTPRDLNLSLQQLALGAVMGACIGIFIAQPSSGSATAATVIGPVALSASALSFLAGFGVDAVFATLETVIARIFNQQPAGTPTPPPVA